MGPQKIKKMKKAFVIFLIFFVQISNAQSIYICNNGEVSFFSKTVLEDIDATSKNLNSILNIATGEIVFVVPITSFKFKKALMQEHFNEKYLESEKYPKATYQGKINEKPDFSKDGDYEITSTGVLSIHGVDQQRTEKGKLSVKNGIFTIQCDFNVPIKDHKIEIPKLLAQNIADSVMVKFLASYTVFKKDK